MCCSAVLMFAILLAVVCSNLPDTCLLDKTWRIRLLLDFHYLFIFYYRSTYLSSASFVTLILHKSVNINLLVFFFILILFNHLECNCDITSHYIQLTFTQFPLKSIFLPLNRYSISAYVAFFRFSNLLSCRDNIGPPLICLSFLVSSSVFYPLLRPCLQATSLKS